MEFVFFLYFVDSLFINLSYFISGSMDVFAGSNVTSLYTIGENIFPKVFDLMNPHSES